MLRNNKNQGTFENCQNDVSNWTVEGEGMSLAIIYFIYFVDHMDLNKTQHSKISDYNLWKQKAVWHILFLILLAEALHWEPAEVPIIITLHLGAQITNEAASILSDSADSQRERPQIFSAVLP